MNALRFAAQVVAPACFIALFVVVAALRVSYPYELEWMEGGVLDHVERVRDGEPLYVEPSLDFTPFIYTPLYFWTAAGAAMLLGDGFLPLRLVSALSSLGCFGLLFLLTRRESGSWRAGLLAAGLYAATFEAAGAWLDVARVDALFMLLLLGGVYAVRWARGTAGLSVGGLLLGLAFLAKQTALVIALPVVLWTVLARRGPARWACAAAFALAAGGSTLALDVLSEGWFTYYVFTLPGDHSLLPSLAVSFWSADVLRPLGWAALAAVVFLASARRDQQLFYGLLLVGLVGASYASRLHDGGYLNVLLPVYAGLALGFALGVERAAAWVEQQGRGVRALLWTAVGVQFVALLYNPVYQIPSAADRAAGDRFVERLRDVPGEVLVVSHPYLAERAGKPGHAHEMALFDVWRGAAVQRDPLVAEIGAALRARRYGALIFDKPWWGVPDDVDAYYRAVAPPFDGPRSFWPKTGYPTRPAYFYVERDAARTSPAPTSPESTTTP